jgi:single-strand DNA-binding protein
MEGHCKATLLGTLGVDADLRFGQNGQAVLSMRLAVNKSFMKDGAKQERVSWFTVVCFGKRAEGLAQHCTKGTSLLVETEPRSRTYEDKDGNKRSVVEFVLCDLVFVSSARGKQSQGDGAPQERRERGQGQPPTDDEATGGGYGEESDIPF